MSRQSIQTLSTFSDERMFRDPLPEVSERLSLSCWLLIELVLCFDFQLFVHQNNWNWVSFELSASARSQLNAESWIWSDAEYLFSKCLETYKTRFLDSSIQIYYIDSIDMSKYCNLYLKTVVAFMMNKAWYRYSISRCDPSRKVMRTHAQISLDTTQLKWLKRIHPHYQLFAQRVHISEGTFIWLSFILWYQTVAAANCQWLRSSIGIESYNRSNGVNHWCTASRSTNSPKK